MDLGAVHPPDGRRGTTIEQPESGGFFVVMNQPVARTLLHLSPWRSRRPRGAGFSASLRSHGVRPCLPHSRSRWRSDHRTSREGETDGDEECGDRVVSSG